MRFLNSAIEAELDADYSLAIKCYLPLSRQGSMLDRIGIYQAIARCFEKSGSNRKAAYWHDRTGQGYLKLAASMMGQQERTYYAVVEFRAAIQDYAPNLSRRSAVRNYLRTFAKIHAYRKASVLFADTAMQLHKEGQDVLARESYRLGAQYHRKSRSATLARKLRAAAALG